MVGCDRMKRSKEEPQPNNNNDDPFARFGNEPFVPPTSSAVNPFAPAKRKLFGPISPSAVDSGEDYSPEKKKPKHNPADHEDSPISRTPNIRESGSNFRIDDNKILSSSGKELASLQQQQRRYDHDQQDPELELIPVRQLFKEDMPSRTVLINKLKDLTEPNLVEKLKQLLETETNIDFGLKMARMVYLLQLNSPFNDEFGEVGSKAGKGARLLLEGHCLLNEAKDLLRSVINKFDP